MKIKKNKKGYAGALVDFHSWIFFFIIIVIFVMLFKVITKTPQREEAIEAVNANSESLLLYSFLRSPTDQIAPKKTSPEMLEFLEDISAEKTMDGMIVEYYSKGKLSSLKPLFKEVFDPVFAIGNGLNDWRGWDVRIYLEPGDKEVSIMSSTEPYKQGLLNTVLSTAYLPLPEDKNYLKLELYKKGSGSAMKDPLYE